MVQSKTIYHTIKAILLVLKIVIMIQMVEVVLQVIKVDGGTILVIILISMA